MDERRKAVALLAVPLAALIALAGCSGSSDDSSGSSAAGREQHPASAPAGAPAAPGVGPGGTTLGISNRAVVYTGTLDLQATDVSKAASTAIRTVLAAGGYVGTDARHSGKQPTVALTLQVPSKKFTSTVDALAGLGTETSRQLAAEDKQAATIDLDAQIASQRSSVNRVRALLSRANSLAELTQIESELTTRQTALATSEAQRRRLADEVSYSSLTLRLTKPTTVIKPPAKKPTELGLVAGLSHGWSAFVSTLAVVLTVIGWLAPFVALGALVGVPAWLLWRRRPRPAAAPSTE